MASVRCHRSEQVNVQHTDNRCQHSESVCRGKSAGREDNKDDTEAIFRSLCAVTEHFSPRGRVVKGVRHLDHVWSYGLREVVSSIPDRGNIVGWVFHHDQVTGKVFSSEHAFPSKFWIYLEHCPRGEAVITGHLRLSSMRYQPRKKLPFRPLLLLLLYSVTILDQNPGRRALALDHHVYDQLSNMWLRRSSEPQPYAMLTVTPVGEDYADLGFPIKSRTRSSILPSMADSGCQSCLGGMRLLPRLGMTADDLIPVSTKMHAANGKGINILGAAILRLSGKSRETRQITYITDNSDKLFLCREACISLGMITARFPMVGWRGDEPLMSTAFVCWEHAWYRHWHTGVAAHGDRNHSLCQPNFLKLHTWKTDQNCRNIYWTTTHRARSTPANISCYPWCKDHHSDSWSTLTPPQWPTTPQSQSLCIGRRKSKPGWTAMCDSVWSNQSPLATQWHTATGWSYARRRMGNQGGPWTFSRSMSTPLGKHTAPNPRSTRPDRYPQAWRKLSLMPGMATTESLYIRMTDTWPLSSRRGGDTAIESGLKVMLLLATANHGASTKLSQTSGTKLSASMTLSCGNGPRGQLPQSDQVARLVWHERYYPQPREVHIRSRHCWIRWIWGNTWQRSAQPEVPSCNQELPYTSEHNWY